MAVTNLLRDLRFDPLQFVLVRRSVLEGVVVTVDANGLKDLFVVKLNRLLRLRRSECCAQIANGGLELRDQFVSRICRFGYLPGCAACERSILPRSCIDSGQRRRFGGGSLDRSMGSAVGAGQPVGRDDLLGGVDIVLNPQYPSGRRCGPVRRWGPARRRSPSPGDGRPLRGRVERPEVRHDRRTPLGSTTASAVGFFDTAAPREAECCCRDNCSEVELHELRSPCTNCDQREETVESGCRVLRCWAYFQGDGVDYTTTVGFEHFVER